jgi:hypothetical protein
MPDGRMAALRPAPGVNPGVGGREESPGSTEARCRVTPGGGDPRESATETYRRARRPAFFRPLAEPGEIGTAWAARVKWCGKSAPRRRQRRRQGKPHREQDRIGAAGGISGEIPGHARQGHSRPAARVGRARRAARRVPEEWPSRLVKGRTEPGLQAVWRIAMQKLTIGCADSLSPCGRGWVRGATDRR